jgi:hypothetical protein
MRQCTPCSVRDVFGGFRYILVGVSSCTSGSLDTSCWFLCVLILMCSDGMLVPRRTLVSRTSVIFRTLLSLLYISYRILLELRTTTRMHKDR